MFKIFIVALGFAPLFSFAGELSTNEIKGIESSTHLVRELKKYDDPRKAMAAYREYLKGEGTVAKKEEELKGLTLDRVEQLRLTMEAELAREEFKHKVSDIGKDIKSLKKGSGGVPKEY